MSVREPVGRRAFVVGNSGIATPAFRSTDASSTYGARRSGGALPVTTFLTTGSTTIGATMD